MTKNSSECIIQDGTCVVHGGTKFTSVSIVKTVGKIEGLEKVKAQTKCFCDKHE